MENLFKYSEIFKGRAATKGQTLGTIPSNSKFIEIIGINYADDNNFYYFTPIILRTEIIRNRDIAFTVGITSDTREFVLSFKNKIGIPNNSTIVSVSSAQSPGYCEYCTYNYDEDSAYVGNIVNSANPRWVTINVAYI